MRKTLIYIGCFVLAAIIYMLLCIYFFPQVPANSRAIVGLAVYLGFLGAALSGARAIERQKK